MKYYPLPNMRLCKDDLFTVFEGRDDFPQIKKKIKRLNAKQMQYMADKLSSSLIADGWYERLNIIAGDLLK
jgi:hypothetical protein